MALNSGVVIVHLIESAIHQQHALECNYSTKTNASIFHMRHHCWHEMQNNIGGL
jgi:hypothetical protein